MANRLAGKKSVLVNKGAALDAEIKALQEDLKEVKKELEGYNLEKGTYTTAKGGVLKITETKRFTDVNPIAAHQHMKDQRLGKNFPSVCKIVLKDFKKYCSDDELAELRSEKGISQRWSWS